MEHGWTNSLNKYRSKIGR